MAADGMSFDGYIDNPSGGQMITNRQMYKELYTKKFDAILLREGGSVKFKVYHENNKFDTYYIHMKIPSEVVSKLYYDVVVQLSTRQSPKKVDSSLRNYMVRFFSNDPAFVFTFAHAFNKHDLFIKELEKPMSRSSLKSVAKERNPQDNIFYVKSLYFAYLTMERYSLFRRPVLDSMKQKFDKNLLIQSIVPAETMIKRRQIEGAKVEKEKREEAKKKKEVREINHPVKHSGTSKIAKVSSVGTKSRMVKTTKTVKKK